MKIIVKYFKILCVFTAFLIVLSAFNQYPIKLRTDVKQGFRPFESGWTCEMNSIESFPYMIEGNADTFWISNELPDVTENDSLIIRDSFKGLRVYVDQQLIYEYMPTVTAFNKIRGDIYLYIPLQTAYSHQKVSFEIIGDTQIPGGISMIAIGDEAAHMLALLQENAINIVILLMMLLFGLGLIAVAAYLDFRKKTYDYRVFLYLGVFALISAVWLWTDSPAYHVNEADAAAVSLLSFISFMAIPLPIVAFVNVICVKQKRLLQVLINILYLNLLIQPVLYILNLTNFITLLPLTHALIVGSVVCMVYALIQEIKTSNSMMAKGILIALSILIVFSLVSLVQFYIRPIVTGRTSFMFGFIAFIILLVYFCIKRVWLLYEQNTKLALYHKLAYNDIMTNAKNRTAFNEKMAQLMNLSTEAMALMILDINNLKQVNDQYGHHEGDEMIINTCHCILNAFSEIGEVYRIGGDEFVVLMLNKPENLDIYLSRLEMVIQRFNADHQHPISLAYGCAVGSDQTDIENLFKQADKNMYQCKFNQKAHSGQ
ncbi:GGDEF domain-containing protein [Dielma fastidiosa]|uniref:GGDEF domain-containing protein n=1 Tax=Dielma fastidiosa TaxID=1034346 RepID=UPI000E49AEF0|nr:GGDEF domain-containing protein [Dielma fastidiosa]RHN01437.1 GGDEF domain-containing protein [Dielma fastidiosa]